MITINPEALESARVHDEQRAGGSASGGMQGWTPDRDAGLVTKLRQAGAIILGKANLSEWANFMDSCMPNGFSAVGGQTENPYGPFEMFGSSSGSNIAAAANLAAVTVGSETQGSLLLPAGINNVVAIKTSKGLVSGDYIIPLLPFQDVAGPMARSVTDAATLLTAMAGEDENDPETQNAAELSGVDFAQFASMEAAQDRRIGLVVQTEQSVAALLDQAEIAEEERDATAQALLAQNDILRTVGSLFAAAGMEVVEIPADDVPATPNASAALAPGFKRAVNGFLDSLGDAAPVGSLAEIIAFNEEDPANRMPYGQDHLQEAQASDLTDEEWSALREQHISETQAAFQALFDTYNVDMFIDNDTQAYAAAGYPAITIPVTLDAEGKPLSFHIVGDYLSEPSLITAGYVLEQSVDPRVDPDLEATMQLIQQMSGQ